MIYEISKEHVTVFVTSRNSQDHMSNLDNKDS